MVDMPNEYLREYRDLDSFKESVDDLNKYINGKHNLNFPEDFKMAEFKQILHELYVMENAIYPTPKAFFNIVMKQKQLLTFMADLKNLDNENYKQFSKFRGLTGQVLGNIDFIGSHLNISFDLNELQPIETPDALAPNNGQEVINEVMNGVNGTTGRTKGILKGLAATVITQVITSSLQKYSGIDVLIYNQNLKPFIEILVNEAINPELWSNLYAKLEEWRKFIAQKLQKFLRKDSESDEFISKTKQLDIEKNHSELEEILEMGYHHYQQGDYAMAGQLAVQAEQYCKNHNILTHTLYVDSLHILGMVEYTTGQYEPAEAHFKLALEISEKFLGPNHDRTAESLNNLATLYHKKGQYAEALPLYERALEICEKVLGPNHERTANSLNNLAQLYEVQGKNGDALPLYQRALKITKIELGPNHERTADILNNLGLLYQNQSNYAAALPLLQQALEIYEEALGPNHERTANSLNNLAELNKILGNNADVLTLLKRALDITEKALGPNHASTATCLNNLADFYYSQGNYAEALPMFQRALEITEKALGPNHALTAESLNSLACLYYSQGNYAEALPMFQRALNIREKALGPDHESTATSLNNLAQVYKKTGQLWRGIAPP